MYAEQTADLGSSRPPATARSGPGAACEPPSMRSSSGAIVARSRRTLDRDHSSRPTDSAGGSALAA